MFKNKMILGLIFVVGLGLGLGSAWATVNKKPTQEAKVKSKITGQKGTQIGEVKKVKVKTLSPVKQAQAKTPTLLWKKEFATAINAVAMSADGKYIAVTTDAKSLDPTGGKPFKGSKLCFFNKSGKLLWQYTKGDNWQLAGVEMSDDGNYVAVALAKKVVVDSGIIEGEYYETVEFHINEILFLDRAGNLLWKRTAAGFPKMSKDGKYVLVRSEDYGDYHKFFDKKGNILWQKPNTLEDLRIYGEGLSVDGNYVIIDNTLYDKKGKILHIFNVGEEEVEPVISPYGNYIALHSIEKSAVYDKKGVLLWELPKEGDRIIKFSPDENYLIVDSWGKIKFFSKSGQLLWSKDKEDSPSYTPGGCIFSGDGNLFVIGVANKAYFCNKSGNIIWKIEFSEDIYNDHLPGRNISMSSNGKYLVIGAGSSLYLYDNPRSN